MLGSPHFPIIMSMHRHIDRVLIPERMKVQLCYKVCAIQLEVSVMHTSDQDREKKLRQLSARILNASAVMISYNFLL